MIGMVICWAALGVLSFILILCGILCKEWFSIISGVIWAVVIVGSMFETFFVEYEMHIPAEPLARNQTQTVFTTDKGTYIANGLYPDGTYLLTVDGKDVLVVWQAVDGEVG